MIEPFLLGAGMPGERRGIIEPMVDHLRLPEIYRAPFVGLTANRHDIIILGVPEVLQRFAALPRDIYTDLTHDGSGIGIQSAGLVSCRIRVQVISPQGTGK